MFVCLSVLCLHPSPNHPSHSTSLHSQKQDKHCPTQIRQQQKEAARPDFSYWWKLKHDVGKTRPSFKTDPQSLKSGPRSASITHQSRMRSRRFAWTSREKFSHFRCYERRLEIQETAIHKRREDEAATGNSFNLKERSLFLFFFSFFLTCFSTKYWFQ